MTTYIVACGEKKLLHTAKAKDLYQGSYFSACFNYASEMSNDVYIISAKYGLIKPDDHISPYNLRITDKLAITTQEVKEQAIRFNILENDIIILGGSNYVKFIKKIWPNAKHVLKGGLLQQIKWLNEQTRIEKAKKQLTFWEK